MSTRNVVGVAISGVVEWHAAPIGASDYDTMCGIDANDPTIGHDGTVVQKRGQKITCVSCYGMWRGVRALRLREDNFDRVAKL